MSDTIPNIWESVENNVLELWLAAELGFLRVFVPLIIYSSFVLILIIPLLGRIVLCWGVLEYTSEWHTREGLRKIGRAIFVILVMVLLEASVPSNIKVYHDKLSLKELNSLVSFFELIADGLLYLCAMLSLIVIMIALLGILLADSNHSRNRAFSRLQKGVLVFLLIIVPISLSYMAIKFPQFPSINN